MPPTSFEHITKCAVLSLQGHEATGKDQVMVLKSTTRYLVEFVLALTALVSFRARTTQSFVLSTRSRPLSREQPCCPDLSTRRYLEMVEPGESSPLLLISRLDHYGLGEDAKARLVLASQSPRRREILDMMMLKGRYSVETPPLDETMLQQELSRSTVITSVEYTRKLAEAKAFSLADRHLADGTSSSDTRPTFYLGSDTVVELDDRILEKPKDPEDAKRMLAMMSGRQHHVHTGVAVYRLMANEITLIASFTDTATVTFASLSEETIDDYVATGEPLDKAGSYGIQGAGGQLATSITGDFFTVMGLPMHKTSLVLASALDNLC